MTIPWDDLKAELEKPRPWHWHARVEIKKLFTRYPRNAQLFITRHWEWMIRGWSRQDVWDFRSAEARRISAMLRYMARTTPGYPASVDWDGTPFASSYEDWIEKLNEAADSFAAFARDDTLDLTPEEEKAFYLEFKKQAMWVAHVWPCLWT